MGYRVGSVVYCRPAEVVQRKVPSGSWSTFHLGCCLSRWSCLHLGPVLQRQVRPPASYGMLCSWSHWAAGRRQTGLVQVACRTWDRCLSLAPGSWPLAWWRWSHGSVVRESTVTIRSGPPRGVRSRQVPYPLPGGPSRLAAVKENPGGPGPARLRWLLGSGRAQPWAMAWPWLSVTVRHQVVLGLAAAARVRSRASQGSTGPSPASSPGRSARPDRVASGTVRVTRPANPAGIWPPAGPARGRLSRAGAGAGVFAQEQVEVGAGAELVHVALEPGLAQFPGPAGDPLAGGQDLVRGQLAAHQGSVAGVLDPPFHPGVLGCLFPAFLRFLGGDFHHRCSDRGAQTAWGQASSPVQDLVLGGASLGVIEQGGGAGDDLGLLPGDRPAGQPGPGAGQPGLEGLGQVDQDLRPAAGLGQRVGHLIRDELLILGLRAAAGQLGYGGQLARDRMRLDPVPRAQ